MSVDELKKQTPMMERYLEVKRQNPGSLLLFRMGDFFELFFDDAQLAAKVLGLTLTSRDKGSPNPVPMAGFPYHALENYLQKLIHAGLRVAICDQVEDAKLAKGLVRREVTRIVTPGTLVDEGLLDPRKCNFLASVWPDKSGLGLAWLELSTGRFVAAHINPQSLADELARLEPAECLVPESALPPAITTVLAEREGMLTSLRPAWNFARADCRRLLLEHFGTTTLDGFDLDENSPGVTAAGALLQYVQETQKSALGHIVRLEPYRRGSSLLIDESTRRSLELTETLRTGAREGSLLSVIDATVTPMGARVLAERLANPLTDAAAIDERLDAVEELTQDAVLMRDRARRTRAGLRSRAADGARRDGAGRSARPGMSRKNAFTACPSSRPAWQRVVRVGLSNWKISLTCVPMFGRRSNGQSPTSRRSERSKATSFAPAIIRSSTSCAVWPAAARNGSPAIRPRKSPAPGFPI